jgi:hypothetical protein
VEEHSPTKVDMAVVAAVHSSADPVGLKGMTMMMKKTLMDHTAKKMMTNTTMKKLLHPGVVEAGGTAELLLQATVNQTEAAVVKDKGERRVPKLKRGRYYWSDREEGKKIAILRRNKKEAMASHMNQMTKQPLVPAIPMALRASGSQQNICRLKHLV